MQPMRGGHGVDLGHNDRVDDLQLEVLSDHWYVLRKATFDYRHRDGRVTCEVREAYDRGNGVTILLHDHGRHRDPHPPVPAARVPQRASRRDARGDGSGPARPAWEDPEEAIRREAEEECGVRVGEVRRLFELFMSPGSVTERVTFFAATYSHDQRVSAGGGLVAEGEDIEVLELDLDDALAMVATGAIQDAKTVILLQWAAMQRAGDEP